MRHFYLLLGCLTLLYSCSQYSEIGDIDEIDYQPTIAVPLANSLLSIEEILDAEEDLDFIRTTSDGELILEYAVDPIVYGINEFIQESYDFPLLITEQSVSVPLVLEDFGSINRMDLRAGTLSFEVFSNYEEDINLTITLPDMRKDGQALTFTGLLDYRGQTPVRLSFPAVDVTGYTLQTNFDGNILVIYEAMNMDNLPMDLDPFTGQARGWAFDQVVASVKEQNIPALVDSVELDVYDSWVEGEVSFERPQLDIELVNSYGFPVRARIIQLDIVTQDDRIVPFQIAPEDRIVDLAYPSVNEIGQSKTTIVRFDADNTNITDLFTERPKQVRYRVDFTINPENTESEGFLTQNSQLTTSGRIELPLFGQASGFTLELDVELDPTEEEEIDEIDEAELKFLSDNGIPVELYLQFYFQDAEGNTFDSLFTSGQTLLQAAEVDGDGNVSSSTATTEFITVSGERLKAMLAAEQGLAISRLSTTNNGMEAVRITPEQQLGISIGVKATIDPE